MASDVKSSQLEGKDREGRCDMFEGGRAVEGC